MKSLTPSGVMGDECKQLAGELLLQPELLRAVFSDSAPLETVEELQRAEAIKRYTGERSATDDSRLLMVGALRLLGASDREIERTCGVTRRTIPVLLQELERSGRVTPLKDRLIRLVGDNAERSGMVLRKLLEQAQDGRCTLDLAAMLKAVGSVNDFQLDKLQLLTGQATEIVQTNVAAGREEFERWWKEAAVTVTPAKECESSALQPIVEVLTTLSPVVTSEIHDDGERVACPLPPGGGSQPGAAPETPML